MNWNGAVESNLIAPPSDAAPPNKRDSRDAEMESYNEADGYGTQSFDIGTER